MANRRVFRTGAFYSLERLNGFYLLYLEGHCTRKYTTTVVSRYDKLIEEPKEQAILVILH